MEKFLDKINTEAGDISVWFDSVHNKPVSVCFYPDLGDEPDNFVEIMIEDLPRLMTEIAKITKP